MANILIRSIEKVDLYSKDSSDEEDISHQAKVVVDLTADRAILVDHADSSARRTAIIDASLQVDRIGA